MYMDRRQEQVLGNSQPRQNPQAFLLENVSVKYGNYVALHSLQLSISAGEILFVTGASGAGKTTLMNLLAGHIDPTSGRVLKKSGHFTSYVFQDLRLMNQKSCEDNLWLSFDKTIYKNKNEFNSELTELCKLMGVWDRLGLKMQDANGGLKQKMSMIRALLARPQILLADEPTSMLDRNSAVNMFEILNYYNTKRGMTIVWSTHNKELIKQFPGRLIHLDQGKLVYSGQACFI
ncbi:MAG: cell division ATP-binding protein FtsE [Bacteriovoracaceae bacterium]